jgi:hypothetical protein
MMKGIWKYLPSTDSWLIAKGRNRAKISTSLVAILDKGTMNNRSSLIVKKPTQ